MGRCVSKCARERASARRSREPPVSSSLHSPHVSSAGGGDAPVKGAGSPPRAFSSASAAFTITYDLSTSRMVARLASASAGVSAGAGEAEGKKIFLRASRTFFGSRLLAFDSFSFGVGAGTGWLATAGAAGLSGLPPQKCSRRYGTKSCTSSSLRFPLGSTK